ncbi:CHRD domain-containing protein, partial [Arthrospira platensis SPKY2]
MLLGVFALSAGAHAAPMTFKATLSGDQEVPPVASPGTGEVTVVFDPVAMTMAIDLWFSGLVAPTAPNAAHIHCCTTVPGEQNVGVATPTPTFVGFP